MRCVHRIKVNYVSYIDVFLVAFLNSSCIHTHTHTHTHILCLCGCTGTRCCVVTLEIYCNCCVVLPHLGPGFMKTISCGVRGPLHNVKMNHLNVMFMFLLFSVSHHKPNTEHPKTLWNLLCTLATMYVSLAVKVMCNYCGIIFVCDSNPHSQSSFWLHTYTFNLYECYSFVEVLAAAYWQGK